MTSLRECVHPLRAASFRAREAERDESGRTFEPAPNFHLSRLRCRRGRSAVVRAERARRSSPPTADRNDMDMALRRLLAPIFQAVFIA